MASENEQVLRLDIKPLLARRVAEASDDLATRHACSDPILGDAE